MRILLVTPESEALQGLINTLRELGCQVTVSENEGDASVELTPDTTAVIVDGEDPNLPVSTFDIVSALCPAAQKIIIGKNEELSTIGKQYGARCEQAEQIADILEKIHA